MTSKDIAIKVENLSKVYRIGLKESMHDSIGSAIFDFIKNPLRNYLKYRSLYRFNDTNLNPESGVDKGPSDIIWALWDISFELRRGEVLGIIGSNGAGKSTLLKILSKITEPSMGRAEVHGRVSCLLEVGTGFHQELTGRENVYLNGTVLGMSKKEIDKKFDEIVEFSGVKKFIDTPIKRYSSGMMIRLAFSVAAHLEPEILIIDEVLAVGDVAFQHKCIGKMGAVAKSGRTVLFVSHNMRAVMELCGRALWLDNGIIQKIGSPSEIVSLYLQSGIKGRSHWQDLANSNNGLEVQLKSARLINEDSQPESVIGFNSICRIEITYDVIQGIFNLSVGFILFNSENVPIFESMDTDNIEWKGRNREPGRYISTCKLPQFLLKPGYYHVSLYSFVDRLKIFEKHENALNFEVSEHGYFMTDDRFGILTPKLEWEVNRIGGISRSSVRTTVMGERSL